MKPYEFPLHVIKHPFDGFFDLKYEQKGRVKIALGFIFLMALVRIVQKQFTGFSLHTYNLNQLNSLHELIYIVLPFLLWCVSNWAITTLMDGEGKFVEIVIVTAYSLLPMILIIPPFVLISNFMTINEGTFYYMFTTFSMLWSLGLLFVGTMTIHQYTVSKTVVTILFTLIVVGIILFLGLLLFSLIQQIVSFIITIYIEITYRV